MGEEICRKVLWHILDGLWGDLDMRRRLRLLRIGYKAFVVLRVGPVRPIL